MQALGHIELISFYVSSICHPIILGIDWIQRHEPTINWAKLLIDFESSYCVNNCTASVIPTQDNTSRDMDHMEVALNFSDKLTEHVYPYVSSTPIHDATLPEEILKEFSSIFDIEAATVLPSSSRYDFRIELLPGFTPPHGKVYSLTPKEQVAMREYVDTNLKKGFIRPSTSPAAAPCFFVKKKDGTLRPIQDYRGLNSGTVKIMSFGTANSPGHFQSVISSIFKDLIGVTVQVYLDDIIVYSENPTDHHKHVRQVLQRSEGVSMDPAKVQSISEWSQPRNMHDIQVFLGFSNYYRRFINEYARITQPLTALLRKNMEFVWNEAAASAFQSIKSAFISHVMISHPDETREFVVEVNASDYALGGVLSQMDDTQSLRPVAFYSRQLCPAERNYEIYDKELLAIVACLKEWRHYLQGSLHPFIVLTDHKNLEYFKTTKQLTRRQARWSELLAEYDYKLSYRPGSHNGKADHLSRRPDYQVKKEDHNLVRLLQPSLFISTLTGRQSVLSPTLGRYVFTDTDWPLLISDFLTTDEWLPSIPEDLRTMCVKELSNFILSNNVLCRVLPDRSKVSYQPSWQRKQVYKRFHDGLGHLKYDSIYDLVSRRHWWPTLKQDLKDYLRRCPRCQLDQSSNSTYAATPIRPVPSVAIPFERWGLDFIQDLPETKSGNRHIITAIDYATRWVVAKAVPNRDAVTVASFFVRYHDGLWGTI
ncbi:hypothetical protein BASA62_009802 [Batrachochytrium salamandrivorans]|nr:hypothetical protein BASA62_009802 [Batrachochytrium salamandrivorans]